MIRRSKFAFAGVIISFLIFSSLAGRADAHAIVVEANPAANSTASGPDVKFKLRFNARIDQGRSRMVLVLPDGTQKPLAILEKEPPDTLAGEGDGLAPGSYRLRWQVLANDGHITQGEIPFAVRVP
jgi:copper resistance protein C